jgi:hypothetical protein
MLQEDLLRTISTICYIGVTALAFCGVPSLAGAATQRAERIFERTFESRKSYSDPFNDVDVDVVFSRGGRSWRVPSFWHGGGTWTVRFAPPEPGEYSYHLESTDATNPDLNGQAGLVAITTYRGENNLLRHGAPRVSANGRHFEHADGTPFYWLGEDWYSGLSTRIDWKQFQKLAKDRRDKGFTVIEVCAGLAPSNEELAPIDPPFRNEGGPVWDAEFKQINPLYFNYADRRIQYLIDSGMTPAIIGGWQQIIKQMGVAKLKKHWRYIIARYGAYPVFWIGGGEIYDPPRDQRKDISVEGKIYEKATPGWTEVIRYIRSIDPYQRPLTVHEDFAPYDIPLQDESLRDFELVQPSHGGWPSVATAIAQLNLRYSRRTVTKPTVIGEINFEGFGGAFHADVQRASFWLSMLNGAAGFSYGTIETAMFPSPEQTFSRIKYTFLTVEEATGLPGSFQIGIGAKLLRNFSWWELVPHPDWVSQSGTTLLKPNDKVSGFDIDMTASILEDGKGGALNEAQLPLGEWSRHGGDWRLPYAAGIPRKLRLIYLPYFGYRAGPIPQVLQLEPDVSYQAYYWEPSLGIKVGLGTIRAGMGNLPGSIDRNNIERRLFDARGTYRGELRGPGWDDYGSHQTIVGRTYQPERPPTVGDWLLVLEATGA